MLLNLSRSFQFTGDQKEYEVDYIFTKETDTGVTASHICLALDISVNKEKKNTHKISKSTATLYLSNEAIEEMIREETITFLTGKS